MSDFDWTRDATPSQKKANPAGPHAAEETAPAAPTSSHQPPAAPNKLNNGPAAVMAEAGGANDHSAVANAKLNQKASAFAGMYDEGQKEDKKPAASTDDAGKKGADPAAQQEQKVMQRAQEIKDKPYKPVEGADAEKLMYSANGIPLNDEAWAQQSAIDGGKLLRMYSKLKEKGGYKDNDPKLEKLLIDGYLKEANDKGKDAAFMAEFLPTDTSHMGEALKRYGSHMGGAQGGERGLQANGAVSQIRLGDMEVAEAFEAQHPGKDMYALPIPYSNTVENILDNDAKPKDGAAKLTEYMDKIKNKDVSTLATGYSQGGAAVLEYEAEHKKNDQGLDYGVAIAPMGGANQHGESGIWSGKRDNTSTLAIEHTLDPARGLYDRNTKADINNPLSGKKLPGGVQLPNMPGLNGDLLSHAINFSTSPNTFLHGKPFADDAKKGTYGYPTGELNPYLNDFFKNGAGDKSDYQKKRDWDYLPKDADIPKDAKGKPEYHADPSLSGDSNPSWKSFQPIINNAVGSAKDKVKGKAHDAWDGAKDLGKKGLNTIEKIF